MAKVGNIEDFKLQEEDEKWVEVRILCVGE